MRCQLPQAGRPAKPSFNREEFAMTKCPVCQKQINLEAADSLTWTTPGGAKEVDPTAGTRQFHDGTWYYFDSIECRNRFTQRPDSYLE